MSSKELNRLETIQRSLRREITVPLAAGLLNLSQRQIHNLKAGFRARGPAALVHGHRGRTSNRRVPESERQKIVRLIKKYYREFKPTHISEKLAEIHGLKRHPETIRRIMIAEELWTPRPRRAVEYRCRRPRKEHFGQMEQFDGSYHDWLRNGSPLCLLASIDDATGRITGLRLVEHESTLAVFSFWQEYFEVHGKPCSVYLDRLRAYVNNQLPERDEEMLTQFQRAMKELGVETIPAYSPQAKGRVERLFRTLQDRLVKEMALQRISDPEKANRFMVEEFIPWFNQKHGVVPARRADLHRSLSRTEKESLSSILSRRLWRVVQNDFTVRFNNFWYQLLKDQPVTIRPRERIVVEERLGGQTCLCLRGQELNYEILAQRPEKLKQPWIIPASRAKSRKPYRPSADHPWRKFKINNRHPEISKTA